MVSPFLWCTFFGFFLSLVSEKGNYCSKFLFLHYTQFSECSISYEREERTHIAWSRIAIFTFVSCLKLSLGTKNQSKSALHTRSVCFSLVSCGTLRVISSMVLFLITWKVKHILAMAWIWHRLTKRVEHSRDFYHCWCSGTQLFSCILTPRRFHYLFTCNNALRNDKQRQIFKAHIWLCV